MKVVFKIQFNGHEVDAIFNNYSIPLPEKSDWITIYDLPFRGEILPKVGFAVTGREFMPGNDKVIIHGHWNPEKETQPD